MTDTFSRRSALRGLSIAAGQLLFARVISAAEFAAHSSQGVPAVGNAHLLTVTAVNPQTLRIRIIQQGKQGPAAELGIVPRDWPEPLAPDASSIAAWGNYKVRLEEKPWRVTVLDAYGTQQQQIALESATGAILFQTGSGALFGLGEGGYPLDRRGTTDTMRNGQHGADLAIYGARVPIPLVIGAPGWAVFFAHPWGTFDLRGELGRFLPTEETPTRDIFIFLTASPAELLRAWAELTGFPHMPPLWSLGYQQSHRTLANREEILAEAKTFREKNLPCDAMIWLGTGFCPSGWNTGHGSFTFNPNVFPDPPKILAELHAQNFKAIVHVVSCPEDLHGEVADTGAALSDPSSAAVYWQKHRPLHDAGVDAWWPDEGDELPPASRLARNRMYWEGSQRFAPNTRPFALHRNGYAGMQRYAWLWSGDTFSTWKTLAAQVMVGINTSLCGIPYWGTDTGGFVPTKEFTAELFVRWFQFSAFCPSFRSHGRAWKLRLPWGWNLGSYEPAEFDGQFTAADLPKPEDLHNTEVEAICRKYLNLRYQLLPYLYSAVDETHRTGLPLLRALWLADPADPKAAAISDQYLWGPNILVAPVLEPNAKSRNLYLPRGAWWDWWSNTQHNGGASITREVNLETLPLFVKAGAVIPIGPVKQFAAEKSDVPLTLRIFPGTDGTSTLYEDDGISFDYEKGRATRIACQWNDAAKTLTVTADPAGQSANNQSFTVELAGTPQKKTVALQSNRATVSF